MTDDGGVITATLAEWQRVTDAIARLARSIPSERWDAPSACDGWKNKQLLVHLATGYAVRIETLRAEIERREPAPIDPDAANARQVEQLGASSIEEIITVLIETRGTVAELAGALDPHRLDAVIPHAGGSVVIGDLLRALDTHDLEHAAQLRLATRSGSGRPEFLLPIEGTAGDGCRTSP
jgi:hypothetical protein